MKRVLFKALLVLLLVFDPLAGAEPGGAPPNILFAIADDQGFPHAGAYGDRVVKTPNFDRIARDGVLFTRAFCSSPSCTPSRGAILAGQDFFRLGEGGNLWSTLPKEIEVYPDILEAAGYAVGHTGKGWGPGDFRPGGRARNPAGPRFGSFEEFLRDAPAEKPFAFWLGSQNPHRPYEAGSGVRSGKRIEDVKLPAFLPDSPVVRSDLLDYYVEIERFDAEVGAALTLLDGLGRAANTIVVVTSDNGLPFPRAKTNLYDSGARLPLAVRWPARVKGGRTVDDLVSFIDFAPTFLDAAGLKPRSAMTGRSLLDVLLSERSGRVDPARDRVLIGRERHTNLREGGAGYPMRALRTEKHLYIRNILPERWPAGDPEGFGDVDGGPAKTFMLQERADPRVRALFDLAFAKRPAEELYDLEKDPDQLTNVAARPEEAAAKERLRAELDRLLKARGDPRALGKDAPWDRQEYYGKKQAGSEPKQKAKTSS